MYDIHSTLRPNDIKPTTHIDENRELTIGVSERQIRGQRFSSGLFFSAVLRRAKEIPKKIPDLASKFRLTPLAAAQRIIFDGVRAKAVMNLKIKNGRKFPKTPKGGQCR